MLWGLLKACETAAMLLFALFLFLGKEAGETREEASWRRKSAFTCPKLSFIVIQRSHVIISCWCRETATTAQPLQPPGLGNIFAKIRPSTQTNNRSIAPQAASYPWHQQTPQQASWGTYNYGGWYAAHFNIFSLFFVFFC